LATTSRAARPATLDRRRDSHRQVVALVVVPSSLHGRVDNSSSRPLLAAHELFVGSSVRHCERGSGISVATGPACDASRVGGDLLLGATAFVCVLSRWSPI
jgi:hypothetical protein